MKLPKKPGKVSIADSEEPLWELMQQTHNRQIAEKNAKILYKIQEEKRHSEIKASRIRKQQPELKKTPAKKHPESKIKPAKKSKINPHHQKIKDATAETLDKIILSPQEKLLISTIRNVEDDGINTATISQITGLSEYKVVELQATVINKIILQQRKEKAIKDHLNKDDGLSSR